MKISIPQRLPRLIEPERYGLNGRVPNPRAFQRMAQAANHIAARRGKVLFCKYLQLSAGPTAIEAFTPWMWKQRTSKSATSVTIMMGIAPGADTGAECWVTLDDGTTEIETEHRSYGLTNSPLSEIPLAVISHAVIEQEVSPDTVYEWALHVAGFARVAYLLVYETPSVAREHGDMIVDPAPFLAQAPIYDVGALVRQVNDLRTTGAQPVCNWCRTWTEADAPSTSSSVSANALDDSTVLSDTSAGARFSLRHRGRIDGAVPLVINARGELLSGTQGVVTVKFSDGSSAFMGSFTTAAGATWATDQIVVPDTVDKADIYFAANGGGTFRLDAVSVYQYG
ncbi:MAG TPA: hypothetical protein VFG83_16865 [Kofleriaceae bacterium]|nr:hypothetical protein [Kofleriaceae bacterium]